MRNLRVCLRQKAKRRATPDEIQAVEVRYHLYYEPTKQTAAVEQVKRRRQAYRTRIKEHRRVQRVLRVLTLVEVDNVANAEMR
jgi:hypothetical protein